MFLVFTTCIIIELSGNKEHTIAVTYWKSGDFPANSFIAFTQASKQRVQDIEQQTQDLSTHRLRVIYMNPFEHTNLKFGNLLTFCVIGNCQPETTVFTR